MSEQYLAYIVDRIQRTIKALYRVTDLLSDKEPLKWEMRKKAIDIFSIFTSLRGEDLLLKPVSFEKIERLINQLISFFSLFLEEESVLGINFGVLQEEFRSIKKSVSNRKKEWGMSFVDVQPKGHYIGHKDPPKEGLMEKEVRKDRIFNIIKDKKEITTGELSAMFKECSEKTIQRDLLEMVGKGLLRKKGDKRWRKYMLININS